MRMFVNVLLPLVLVEELTMFVAKGSKTLGSTSGKVMSPAPRLMWFQAVAAAGAADGEVPDEGGVAVARAPRRGLPSMVQLPLSVTSLPGPEAAV